MKATRKSLAVSRTFKLNLFRFSIALLVLAVALGAAEAQAQTVTIKSIRDLGTVAGDPIKPQWVGLIAQGRDDNMYTTTPAGGTSGSVGTAFKITPAGKLTVLHNFTSTEGMPLSGLVLGTDGNFWGTTYNGGHSGCANNQGCGQVFKMTPAGKVTFVYTFTGGNDGGNPVAPPIEASNGKYYGTTQFGGINNQGTIYQIIESGNLTTLFPWDQTNGDQPFGALVQATNGILYGTTTSGNMSCGFDNICATIFSVTTGGAFNELFSFPFGWDQLYNGLVQANDGTLWGAINNGGAHSCGQIFKITTKGVESPEHDFSCAPDGANAAAGLLLATDGNLYGVTQNGGQANVGSLFSITEKGGYKQLASFDSINGAHPSVTLIQNTNGIVYGDANQGGKTTNFGTFYEITGLKFEKTPFVSLVLTAGKVGSTVEILGQGFVTGKTAVSFNGAKATTVTVVSPTYMTAVVPTGATTGFVTVTTPKGTLQSNKKFRVHK
ncbi:MAG TPA: choice-of-anchor tandem repeat GloVer-containing protein [Terriglobales bacterium]|jgi:uncharacterized repeat protein (TIGR03803 family)|nr:choice-of-anchor tandem repeat GloVer-containing protein [Terriglobales bacterium]